MTTQFAPGDLVRARGREWVALPSPRDEWLHLRPLSGAEEDATLLFPDLELEPPQSARFELPADATPAVQATAALLAEALRLSLRRGAGPFRSAAQLNFEPRSYQLVPLLMALRQEVPRILIADDVGIGKTIEAGLILREFMDRGETDAFSVLCPPHLVEQWIRELKDRFGIDATAVTSASAARLERGLPISQSLFDAYRQTVVSLDYIKSEKRRDAFAKACPGFVIVDEAHACVGTHKGKQQRFALLKGLARDEERAIVMLTATPHSGDEDAFGRLLSLIHADFASMDFDDDRYRQRLARHFVQRRRRDLTDEEWQEASAFPTHLSKEEPYRLTPAHRDFHEAVLDYCFGVVETAGTGQRERRLAFWGTLALMRCVGSSPAAALSALRNRAGLEEERMEPQLYDDDGDEEDAVDVEPTPMEIGDAALADLIAQAEALTTAPDPKLDRLIKVMKPIVEDGGQPVVFCRYIATATEVGRALKKKFPKACVETVTGLLTPEERRDRVASMADETPRILVATDCLSEGINLQLLFDTVVHYDLSWNPTRHQQREGRVNRFGQPADTVRSVLMFSPDSAIDGAVLDVILRKAEAIQKATGVTVPLPDERGPVTDALMASMMLRRRSERQFDFFDALSEGTRELEAMWRDAEENEKRSRSRFAQNALKPHHVAPEWEKTRDIIGSPAAARDFIGAAMKRFDTPTDRKKGVVHAPLDGLPHVLRERLSDRGLKGTVRLAEAEPAPSGTTLAGRAHPLVATLSEALLETALEPDALPGLDVGRVGAWPTPAVAERMDVVLMRLRFKITVHGRQERLLLAEEASLVAVGPDGTATSGAPVRDMLLATASGDLAPVARDRQTDKARVRLEAHLDGAISDHVRARADELIEDHARVRAAAKGISRVSVEPVLPPDVIGLFVLLPGAS
ncbi:DEAD/DEAH box helicase [Tranquillimonas alkanivorans]|uniref:Superfamily II DNA or RNA helicase, SNF2 family n=1 Tax=Tranquillimonas alkanivorans TaxID=441119 RepID=A0A1I5VHU5_9RHOB|nr:DEAD/DEAH box helicase [Tranquillimonas alkanivorans]SFQ06917.1 Superfamily II DNA or RNA helicase, SNF2 family [Tranquillimonas alkanivorans]